MARSYNQTTANDVHEKHKKICLDMDVFSTTVTKWYFYWVPYSQINPPGFIFVYLRRVHNSLCCVACSYVPLGGNEGGGGATPTSISIFDSYVNLLI